MKVTPELIREARAGLGLSRPDFAARLGVSLATIGSWEQGRRNPCCKYMRRTLTRLARLAVKRHVTAEISAKTKGIL